MNKIKVNRINVDRINVNGINVNDSLHGNLTDALFGWNTNSAVALKTEWERRKYNTETLVRQV